MNINISNAATLFFPNPSLEMVYFEAIANSIDAGATIVEIDIKINSFSANETLVVKISDNGQGFSDKNFTKFSSLLEIEEEGHKGVGRLVYLRYFKEIEVESVFDNKSIKFLFNNKFKGEYAISDCLNVKNQTLLTFKDYKLDRIKSYDFLKPKEIKKSIMLHFFPLLYNKKISNENLQIIINLETKEPNLKHDFYSDKQIINVSELAKLEEEEINAPELDLFEKLNLYYSVKENFEENSIITAICVDGRTIPIDIISKGGIPNGYEIVFLMYSDLFKGKVNASRQELTLKDEELKIVKKIFSDRVIEIFNEKIP
jgi:hypothetical protein